MGEASGKPAIALLVPSFRGGGAEGANVRLANELVRRGMLVDLLVLTDDGPWRARLDARVRLVTLGVRRAALALGPLQSYLRKRRPRLLMAGPSHVAVVALLARALCRASTAVIVLEHNDLRAQSVRAKRLADRLLPAIVRWSYPAADRLLAVSRGAADSLAAVLRLPAERVGVLYNAVDREEIDSGARQPADHPWFEPSAMPVLLAIGRLVPQKGYPDLLRAMAIVNETLPARLLILGEGPDKAALEAQATALGLGEKVDLLGFQPNPYAYLARASLFVLASRFEGLGNVVLEALACGTPVVSTDCPSGPNEILDSGEYGLLVPVGDPRAMAEAILRLLQDTELQRRLRESGPLRAAEFSVEHAADRFVALLREVRGDSDERGRRPAE